MSLLIVQPHKPVSTCTVGRKVRDLLQATGIDRFQCKLHSVPRASASAAARSGVAVRHFEVARETGSRWLSSVLWDCFGDKFAALLKRRPPKQSHNALAPGLPPNFKVANIQHFRQASWSSHSTFMRFCYRPVQEPPALR